MTSSGSQPTSDRGMTFALFVAAFMLFGLLWLVIDSNVFSTGVGR